MYWSNTFFSAIPGPDVSIKLISSQTSGDGVGVGVILIDGVMVGVTLIDGVMVGVIDGVAVIVGVTDGETGDGVIEGVIDGVTVMVGVTDGLTVYPVPSQEHPVSPETRYV